MNKWPKYRRDEYDSYKDSHRLNFNYPLICYTQIWCYCKRFSNYLIKRGNSDRILTERD